MKDMEKSKKKLSVYTDIYSETNRINKFALLAFAISVLLGVVVFLINLGGDKTNISNAVSAAEIVPSLAGIFIAAIALMAYVKVEDPRVRSVDEIVQARKRVVAQFDLVIASWLRVKNQARITGEANMGFLRHTLSVTQKILEKEFFSTGLMAMVVQVASDRDVDGRRSVPEVIVSLYSSMQDMTEEMGDENSPCKVDSNTSEGSVESDGQGECVYSIESLKVNQIMTAMSELLQYMEELGDDGDIYRHMKDLSYQPLLLRDELEGFTHFNDVPGGSTYERIRNNCGMKNGSKEMAWELKKGVLAKIFNNGKGISYLDCLRLSENDSNEVNLIKKFRPPTSGMIIYTDINTNVPGFIRKNLSVFANEWGIRLVDLGREDPPAEGEGPWLSLYVLDHTQQRDDLYQERLKKMEQRKGGSVGGVLVIDGFPHPYAESLASVVYDLKALMGGGKYPSVAVVATRYVDRFMEEGEENINETKIKGEGVSYFYDPAA